MFFFISPIISLFPQVTLADPPFSTEKSYMLLRHACPIHPFFSFPMLLLNKGVSDLMKIQIWFHNLRILCTMCPDSFSATNHNLKGLLGINHLIETMHFTTIVFDHYYMGHHPLDYVAFHDEGLQDDVNYQMVFVRCMLCHHFHYQLVG